VGGKGSGRKRTVKRVHGSPTCYAGGCRCNVCRKGWREYIAARRARTRPRRYYEDKPDGAVVVPLSHLGCAILSAIEARTSKNRRDILEQLLRLHGGALQFEDDAA
jgi:hypothetical protein